MMKYFLLFLAVLFAAFGCFALAAGFRTVFDGESASLIAGTVALGCGILVAGQVFIIKALDSLRTSIERQSNELAYQREGVAFEANGFDIGGRSEPEPVLAPAAPRVADVAAPAPDLNFGIAQALGTAPVGSLPIDRFGVAARASQTGAHLGEREVTIEPETDRYASTSDEFASAEEPPSRARIDADLLFEAAIARPPAPADAEPQSLAGTAATFGTAPKTSPSLAEMWRRVTARTARFTSQAAAEPPPAPPAVSEAAPAHEPEGSREEAPLYDAEDYGEEPEATRAEPEHEEQSAARSEPPPREPDLGDWFDNALAELDGRAPASPTVAPYPPSSEKPASAAPTEAAHAEAEPEPVAATDEPAEMGRYQADGTTYVMYSDGSIEAQTDQGIYRFGSMAELKAFFEEQTAAQ